VSDSINAYLFDLSGVINTIFGLMKIGRGNVFLKGLRP